MALQVLRAEALTIFFSFFVLLQFWNMFNARTLGSNKLGFSGLKLNPYFIAIATVIVLGQVLIVSVGGTFFRVVPLEALTWIKILGVTLIVLVIGEVARALSCAAGGKRGGEQRVALGA